MPRTARRAPFDVDALWAVRRVGPPTLSPDGALACAAVTSYDMDSNEGATALWLFPTGLAGEARFITASSGPSMLNGWITSRSINVKRGWLIRCETFLREPVM